MRKHHRKFALAACLALSSAWASAEVISLTFEGATGLVNGYYGGGTDSNGHAGVNLGFSFVNGIAVVDNTGGNAYGPPLINGPSSHTVLNQVQNQVVINRSSGFTSGFSLYYVSSDSTLTTVNVYSGLNGTGTLLATFSLPAAPQCTTGAYYYCNWQTAGAAFSGTARSVTLSAVSPPREVHKIFYDNLTFGAAVPMPASGKPSALWR